MLVVVAVVLLAAALVLGRRVGGWRALAALAGLTAFGALALTASGDQPAAALGLGFVAMLVQGAAEPSNDGWCGVRPDAVRLGRGRGVACRRRLVR